MNYKFNLLHHVGVVAKRECAVAAEETTAQEGDDNTPSVSVTSKSICSDARRKYPDLGCLTNSLIVIQLFFFLSLFLFLFEFSKFFKLSR